MSVGVTPSYIRRREARKTWHTVWDINGIRIDRNGEKNQFQAWLRINGVLVMATPGRLQTTFDAAKRCAEDRLNSGAANQ